MVTGGAVQGETKLFNLKKVTNVKRLISNVTGARTYSIESEQDIDKFLAEMKRKLLQELEENSYYIELIIPVGGNST